MLLAFFQWLERRKNISALKKAGTLVPSSLSIGPGVVIEVAKGAKIKIGPNVKIGAHCNIRVFKDGKLEIAAKTEIGPRVSIVCGKTVTILPGAQIGDGAIITDVDPIFGGPNPEYSIQSVTVQENGYISPNAYYGKKPGRSLGRGKPFENSEERPEGNHPRRERGHGSGGGHRRDHRRDRNDRNSGNRRDRGNTNFRDRNENPGNENTDREITVTPVGEKPRLSVPATESLAIGPITTNNNND